MVRLVEVQYEDAGEYDDHEDAEDASDYRVECGLALVCKLNWCTKQITLFDCVT